MDSGTKDFPQTAFLKSPAQAGLFLFLAAAFVASGVFLSRTRDSHRRELVAPPMGLVHFQFGFRVPLADALWVRALQDFDFCENPVTEHTCRGQDWLYQNLDLITELDPRFRMAYSAGGMALTILISDAAGASRLFDKAIRQFPNDWVLLYKAAYHALQEEKNPAKAADLMERAARNGAPDWVYVLAGRLYTDAGQRELATHVLQEMQELGLGEKMQERLRQKIEEGASKPSR